MQKFITFILTSEDTVVVEPVYRIRNFTFRYMWSQMRIEQKYVKIWVGGKCYYGVDFTLKYKKDGTVKLKFRELGA